MGKAVTGACVEHGVGVVYAANDSHVVLLLMIHM